ncbi:MAG: T9SS type A sorting domain-containing protein [Ignavibacteriae bacterium]|nr:T9SS type A sorting domain-containing protein [Ignavibacteriota bacterium]
MKAVSRHQLCVILVLVLFSFSLQYAAEKHPKEGESRASEQMLVSWSKRVRQGSNLKMWLSNTGAVGVQAWDGNVPSDNCGTMGLGATYPDSSCTEHLYGGGPLVGAIVNGIRHVSEGYNGNSGESYFRTDQKDTARDKIWFTSIDTWQSSNRKGIDDDGDGSIDEDELDGTDNDGDWNVATDDLGKDNLSDANETGCRGSYDPVSNPDPAFDNYEPSKRDSCRPDFFGRFPYKSSKDHYTQGNGLPDHGEQHVDEDYGAFSQSDYYCSYTDTFSNAPISHRPLGAKVWQKSYAWQKGSAADAIIMMEYQIVNISNEAWNDIYLGYFADMDIGPIYISNYLHHNYSAYDSSTRTAYTRNPIDRGSTPLGLSLLQTARSFDSLQQTFQWHDFDPPCGGTNDDDVYSCMSCESFGGVCIAPDQLQTSLFDTRFTTSHGPYQTMNPGDTLTMVYAFVAGNSVPDMLNNSRRAERIWKSKGFIMPFVQVHDSGSGRPITLTWSSDARSPFGDVISYKVLYGTESGVYTDSIPTVDTTITFNLPVGQNYYFVVRAVDEFGNEGANSDEMNNFPTAPKHLSAIGGEISITINWDNNSDPDLFGYNIYRRSSIETTFTKLNTNLLTQPNYVDESVWGDKVYFYKVDAVDIDGRLSEFSLEDSAWLKRPSIPKNFAAGAGKNYVRISWYPNDEGDIKEYKLYKKSDSNFQLFTTVSSTTTLVKDTLVTQNSIYGYYLQAVDTTDAIGASTSVWYARPTLPTKSILLVNVPSKTPNYHPPADSFFASLLRDYSYRMVTSTSIYEIESYKTLIVVDENPIYNVTSSVYPYFLKSHILGGKNLIIIGRELLSKRGLFWYEFLNEQFGLESFVVDSNKTFVGAAGFQGFPSIQIDSSKLDSLGGRLNYLERFPNASVDEILYSYQSNPFDATAEGQPVGLRARDTSFHIYYFSFPLYYLDTTSAQAFVDKILSEVGEQPLGVKIDESIPEHFTLLQNYPNPFNPVTIIQFQLPETRFVSLKIYNMIGQEVATLVNEKYLAGSYSVKWNAQNISSGIYYYKMVAGDFVEVKKMLYIR